MRPLLVNEEIARKFADKVFEELKDTVLTCGKIDILLTCMRRKRTRSLFISLKKHGSR